MAMTCISGGRECDGCTACAANRLQLERIFYKRKKRIEKQETEAETDGVLQ